jgi:hypothetical protein
MTAEQAAPIRPPWLVAAEALAASAKLFLPVRVEAAERPVTSQVRRLRTPVVVVVAKKTAALAAPGRLGEAMATATVIMLPMPLPTAAEAEEEHLYSSPPLEALAALAS